MSTVVEFPATNTLAQRVAANIRAEAGRRSVSQSDLARALGVSQPFISARYRGRQEWSLNEIEAVARYLRVTTSMLLGSPNELPRLDSNQKPFGYWYESSRDDEARQGAEVFSLDDERARRRADRHAAVSA